MKLYNYDTQTAVAHLTLKDSSKKESSLKDAKLTFENEISILQDILLRPAEERKGIVETFSAGKKGIFQKAYHYTLHSVIIGKHNPEKYPYYKAFTQQRLYWLFSEIGEGLLNLQKMGISHGDVKPENILIFHHKTSRFPSPFEAALADFGISIRPELLLSNQIKVPTSGTATFSAPEISHQWLGKTNEEKIANVYKRDSFSLAVSASALFYPEFVPWAFGECPSRSKKNITPYLECKNRLLKKVISKNIKVNFDPLRFLLLRGLDPNPITRPSIATLTQAFQILRKRGESTSYPSTSTEGELKHQLSLFHQYRDIPFKEAKRILKESGKPGSYFIIPKKNWLQNHYPVLVYVDSTNKVRKTRLQVNPTKREQLIYDIELFNLLGPI